MSRRDRIWPAEVFDRLVPYESAKIGSLIADETAWVERRVESVSFVDETTHRRHVSVHFEVPEFQHSPGTPAGVALMFVPLAFLKKEVLRNLDVRDETGRALPVLSRRQNAALAAQVLVDQAIEVLEMDAESELKPGSGGCSNQRLASTTLPSRATPGRRRSRFHCSRATRRCSATWPTWGRASCCSPAWMRRPGRRASSSSPTSTTSTRSSPRLARRPGGGGCWRSPRSPSSGLPRLSESRTTGRGSGRRACSTPGAITSKWPVRTRSRSPRRFSIESRAGPTTL